MKIITRELNPSQSSYEKNVVIWEIHFKKNLKTILLQYGAGIILLAIGLIDYKSPSFSAGETTRNGITISSGNHYHFHFMIATSIVYIFITTIGFFNLYAQKRKFFNDGALYAIKYLQPPGIITIEANDISLCYESPFLKMELKWQAFDNFMLYKNYVILNVSDRVDQSILIDKRLITQIELTELTTFIIAQISEKK